VRNRFIGMIAVMTLVLAPRAAQADYAIRDGDTMVFLGDSITAARTYGKIIENYTLLRFPDRKVHFINAGWGGETAAGALKRLQRDVFDRGATVMTVAYGINDIGWGGKADEEHKKLYLDSIRGIVEQCKAHQVRVFICSAAATASDPDKNADDFLQKMCDEGMGISKSMGEGSIDVLKEMRQIQRRIKEANMKESDPKKRETLHVEDGIHLNDLGQTAMAYAILKGLGAPGEVSSATIDAAAGKETASASCKISQVKGSADGVEFHRLDDGLPFNQGLFFNLRYRFVPMTEINRYMLTVTNLKPGKYNVTVDGRSLGNFSAADLAQGVDIASATADGWQPGGPWDAQGWSLNYLTDARNEAVNVDKMSGEHLKQFAGRDDLMKQIAEINTRIEQAQRTVAKPGNYHFVIRPAP
jgi:lysophospholipase L1-like esterase